MAAYPIAVGEVIDDRYRVEHILGQGGMGVVVAARHLRLDRTVAIKFPLAHLVPRHDIVGRLLREARAAAQIGSEHVARVYDIGAHAEAGPYLVMEFLVGQDLHQKVRRDGPLTLGSAIEYVLQAGEALAEAHAIGIVHRDLKPSNLFLSHRADGSPLIKVIDFGLAKILQAQHEISLTNSGAPLGSLHFMAPEQMRGTMPVDVRADVYSIGATLHALLTGIPPFPGSTLLDVYDRITAGAPSISKQRPDVPSAVDTAIQRCLQIAPADRFNNVAELAEALATMAPPHALIHAQRARGTQASASAAPQEPFAPDESCSSSTMPTPATGSWSTSERSAEPALLPGPVAPKQEAGRWSSTLTLRIAVAVLVGLVLAAGALGSRVTRTPSVAPPVHQVALPAAAANGAMPTTSRPTGEGAPQSSNNAAAILERPRAASPPARLTTGCGQDPLKPCAASAAQVALNPDPLDDPN